MNVILKPGREKALKNRHPWIFSGAVATFPSFENGEILSVYSHTGEFLAKAYFNQESSLTGRVLTFADEPTQAVIDRKLTEAISWRAKLFDPAVTDCYRLINAEGDGLPGLIIDIYTDIAVLQVHTLGMERLKPLILEKLREKLPLRGIYEKSESNARQQEGLEESVGPLYGDCPSEITVKENGMQFLVSLEKGQKTGLFLDQREMRQLLLHLGRGKRVLNCFAYTGGFSLFALKGGATHVTSVDRSEEACRYARENTLLNGFSEKQHSILKTDVFDHLQPSKEHFDLIILDPPAFAKKRQDVEEACRGYKEINRRALQMLPKEGYLLTCSCSYFIDTTLFQQLLFQAAVEAGRDVVICSRHTQALDHPISLFHPEGEYLKSLLLYVR